MRRERSPRHAPAMAVAKEGGGGVSKGMEGREHTHTHVNVNVNKGAHKCVSQRPPPPSHPPIQTPMHTPIHTRVFHKGHVPPPPPSSPSLSPSPLTSMMINHQMNTLPLPFQQPFLQPRNTPTLHVQFPLQRRQLQLRVCRAEGGASEGGGGVLYGCVSVETVGEVFGEGVFDCGGEVGGVVCGGFGGEYVKDPCEVVGAASVY